MRGTPCGSSARNWHHGSKRDKLKKHWWVCLREAWEGGSVVGSLEGAVAVVTGAGRGIGRAIAEELGFGGAKVAVNYSRSKEPAEEVVARLSDNGNDQAVAIGADVSKADEAFRLIEETLERFGRIDILVNNAGITIDRTMKKLTVEEWDTVVQVDLNSCYYTVKAALPHFIEQESGYIINMSSFVGEAGNYRQNGPLPGRGWGLHYGPDPQRQRRHLYAIDA